MPAQKRSKADDRVAPILDRLVATGGRRTSARQAIIETILGSGSHVSADEIARRVQARLPTVNLSTVYRTLDALEQIGVIDHVHLGHGRAIYHLADEDHQHLVCERCQHITELPAVKLEPLLRSVVRDHGFEIDRRHFALIGLCKSCRSAENRASRRRKSATTSRARGQKPSRARGSPRR